MTPSLFLCRPLRLHTALVFSKHHFPNSPLSSSNFTLVPVWSCSPSHSSNAPTSQGTAEKMEEQIVGVDKVDILKQKMEVIGILCTDYCVPGKYTNLLCPKCNGGPTMERSLSVHIVQKGDLAMWRCFRTNCSWADKVFADGRAAHNEVKKKVHYSGQMTEKSLKLEPLGEKLTAYFCERMISEETLRRNGVMQRSSNKDIIAFTYKRNGLLVACKYRTIEKSYWQEKASEKILYGIDDINDAAEIIIVEGEIDKLSLEEAGFCNCVSVPDGAPGKSSTKLPPVEKDTAYQYLWNCKQNLDKVSRIILATDNDKPGQALAKDIARRLGTHRCWQVSWPKNDEVSYYKDANEVLKDMGPDALRKVIENAEPYQLCTADQVVQSSDEHKPDKILASQ
ncbi:primase homolog protein [Pyrus x bretschneideri]|uniref:primase homolog protein n=1 Tax=Pyrus x bretschneideri TaxID=225117 RepID=UPI0020301118|nr:primase homolog protein [Pyrus x bretschneideri]